MVRIAVVALVAGSLLLAFSAVHAGTEVGVVRWQFGPFCNVVTLAAEVTGTGATLTGADDNCGGAQSAAFGTIVVNPGGTLAFGLTIVTPGGAAEHVDAVLNVSTFSGTWQDSSGNSGTFQFNPPSPTSGSPRPAPVTAPPPPRLFSAGPLTAPATVFGPVQGTSQAGSLSPQLIPAACTAQGFQARTSRTLVGGEQAIVTLIVESADTLTCTIGPGGATCSSGASLPIAAGSLVGVRADLTSPTSFRVHYGFTC